MKSIGGILHLTTLIASPLLARGGILRGLRRFKDISSLMVENEAAVSSQNPISRRTSIAEADFAPLGCNGAGIENCSPWSSVFPNTVMTSMVTIPCDTCLSLGEFQNGEVLELNDGLNVIGKLDIPEGTNVTVKTSSIIVQGTLSVTSTASVGGEPSVKILLEGTQDVMFVPHSPNENSCPVGGCNVGKKPVVVAGGRLDIRGLPEGCPSWVRMESAGQGNMPEPSEYPKRPDPVADCADSVVDDDFSGGLNGWYGNLGAREEVVDGYLKISDRSTNWQGPMLEVTDAMKECIVPDQMYLFSARIRLSKQGGTSLCSASGTNCPVLKFTHMNAQDQVRFSPLVETNPERVAGDGTWFDVKNTFFLNSTQLSSDDIFSAFTISGPESGVDIDIDDIVISVPPLAAYPDESSVCSDLVSNGDAGLGYAFPMASYDQRSELKVLYDEGDNPYFHISGRTQQYSSLTFDIATGCAVDHSVYRFNSKLWIHSPTPVAARVMLKTFPPEGSSDTPSLDLIQLCPKSSEDTGWIACVGEFRFDADHESSSRMQILFITVGDNASEVDYDDISFTFVSGQAGNGIGLPSTVYPCWGVDSEVVITSMTINYNEEQLATLSSVSEDGTVALKENVKTPTSKVESENFASEFALLSRNIVFEAAADDASNPLHGGHLIILQTPSAGQPQFIEGASFINFGQQGTASRYPVTFYMSGDNTGSIVSKNVVRRSNSRCIVLHGTHNVQVNDNVAYDNFGHCYALEDGSESGNVFRGNLAAKSKRSTSLVPYENDHSPAMFLIKNPQNTYAGNVAAGSQDSGYWFEVPTAIVGESASFYDIDPSILPLTSFENNVAHSNMGDGVKTYPEGYNPASAAVFKHHISYRNRGSGILLRNGRNFVVDGGVFADNKVGIDIEHTDAVLVRNVSIIGYSTDFKRIAETQGTARMCWGASKPIYGIRIPANAKDPTADGVTLEDATIARYNDMLGCPGSKGVMVNDVADLATFTTDASLKRVSLDAESNLISLCPAAEAGINDVKIVDDGSLNPTGENEAGFLVSNNELMTSIAGTCAEIPNSCAQYCYGACLRKVTIGVDPEGTDDMVLVIDDGSGNEMTLDGAYETSSALVDTNWVQRRYYSVDLPDGTYTSAFKTADQTIWPGYAEVTMEEKPLCTPHWESFSLTIPPTDPGTCDDLIRNGNFEAASTDTQWHHTGGGLKIVEGVTGSALSTDGRTGVIHGLAHYVDTRCVNENQRYRISARVKLTAATGGNPDCDPNYAGMGGERCPRANIRSTRDSETSYSFEVGKTVGPFVPGAWNKLIGTFEVTSDMAAADSVAIYFDGVREGVEILLDDVTIVPDDEDCVNVIRNGDFETGDTRDWGFIGPSTGIQIVDNSIYGGTGHSLSTVQREIFYHGMSQIIRTDCLQEGSKYEINLDFRLEGPFGQVSCDPFNAYTNDLTCPAASLKLLTGETESYKDIGWTVGPFQNKQWNKIYGVFEATPDVLAADRVELYVANVAANINEVIDNAVLELADANTFGANTDCTQLIVNGDAEIGDARYWFIKGPSNYGTIDLVQPGAADSEYAFHHHAGRTQLFNGLWQTLDQSCMEVGSTWKVTADFKLFDSQGEPAWCNKAVMGGDTVCPMFLFQSASAGAPYQKAPLKNVAPGDWVADQWNAYEATFVMDQGHKDMEKTWVFIHNVKSDYSYMVDNISVVPA